MSSEAEAAPEPAGQAACATLRLLDAIVIYDAGNHNAWIQSSESCDVTR